MIFIFIILGSFFELAWSLMHIYEQCFIRLKSLEILKQADLDELSVSYSKLYIIFEGKLMLDFIEDSRTFYFPPIDFEFKGLNSNQALPPSIYLENGTNLIIEKRLNISNAFISWGTGLEDAPMGKLYGSPLSSIIFENCSFTNRETSSWLVSTLGDLIFTNCIFKEIKMVNNGSGSVVKLFQNKSSLTIEFSCFENVDSIEWGLFHGVNIKYVDIYEILIQNGNIYKFAQFINTEIISVRKILARSSSFFGLLLFELTKVISIRCFQAFNLTVQDRLLENRFSNFFEGTEFTITNSFILGDFIYIKENLASLYKNITLLNNRILKGLWLGGVVKTALEDNKLMFNVFGEIDLGYSSGVFNFMGCEEIYFNQYILLRNTIFSSFIVTLPSNSHHYIYINLCVFNENQKTSDISPGFMFNVRSGCNFLIEHTNFTLNKIKWFSSLIFYSRERDIYLLFRNSTFSNNEYFEGGKMITFAGGALLLVECNFINNSNVLLTAFDGLLLFMGGNLVVLESLFSNNFFQIGAVMILDSSIFLYKCVIVFKKCVIRGSYGASSAIALNYAYAMNGYFLDCLFEDNYMVYKAFFSIKLSGMVKRKNLSNLTIDKCVFQRNYASLGGCMFIMTEFCRTKIKDTVFISNRALKWGGVFFHYSYSVEVFLVDSCKFLYNRAYKSGVLNLISTSYLDYNSVYFGNSANYFSTINLSSVSYIFLSEVVISSSVAFSSYNIFFNPMSTGEFFKVKITNCTASKINAAIFLHGNLIFKCSSCLLAFNKAKSQAVFGAINQKSYVKMINSDFYTNEATQSLFSFKNSTVLFVNCTFLNSIGSFIDVFGGSLFMVRNIFYNIRIRTKDYGSLIKSREAFVFIQKAIFINITNEFQSILIYFYTSEILLFENIFFRIEGQATDIFIYSATSNIFIRQSFQESKSKYELVSNGGLLVIDRLLLSPVPNYKGIPIYINGFGASIVNAFFFNNRNVPLYAENSNIFVHACTFVNNTATFGAGIYAYDSFLIIKNCSFIKNSAGRHGGAIVLIQKLIDSSSLIFNSSVIISNLFLENSAQFGGGAIYWDLEIEPLIVQNEILLNTAGYGPFVASCPVYIIVENIESVEQLKGYSSGFSLGSEMLFALKDFYNQTVKTFQEHISKISIEINNNSLESAFGLIGTDSVKLLGEASFSFGKFQLIGRPLEEISLKVECSALSSRNGLKLLKQVPIEFLGSNSYHVIINNKYYFILKVVFGYCPPGYVQKHDSQTVKCDQCPENLFSLSGRESNCLPCPSSAKCSDGKITFINSGFWRSSESSIAIYKCSNLYACKGGKVSEDICAIGFGGVLCGSCLPSKAEGTYFLDFDKKCKSCSAGGEKIRAIIIAVCISLTSTLYVGYMIKMRLKSKHNIKTSLLKIFTDYIQLTGIMSFFELDLPIKLRDIFQIDVNIYDIDINNPENFLSSIDCILSDLALQNVDVFYKKKIIIIITSFLTPLLIVGIWLAIAKIRQGGISKAIQNIKIAMIIIFYSYQPSIINTTFKTFQCIMVDGKSYLVAKTSIDCGSDSYTKFINYIIVPYLLVIMIVIPTVNLYKIIVQAKLKSLKPKSLGKKSLIFFHGCYRENYFFWDFIIMTQKYVFILVTTFCEDKTLAANICSFIFFNTFLLQCLCRPFKHDITSTVSIYSRIALFSSITYFLAKTASPPSSVMQPIGIVLIFFNSLFIVCYFFHFYSMNKKLLTFFFKIFYFLPLRRVFIDENSGEKIPISEGIRAATKSIKLWQRRN